MAIVGVALYYVLFNLALAYTSASQTALIQSAFPALVAILAVVWLHERVTRRRFAGIGLAIDARPRRTDRERGRVRVVIGVHLLLFSQSDALAGVVRLAPYNLGAALLILAAGFTTGTRAYALWIAGFVLMAVVPYFIPRYSWVGAARSFHVAPAHFVERHGVLVIIALGESVIAIGAGVDAEHVTAGTVWMMVLALALPAAMWWTYFVDTVAAEHALATADVGRRSLMSTRTYFFAHIPVMLGIIIAAAGIHAAVAHPSEPSTWAAASAMAGGVALFLFGVAASERSLSIGAPWRRLVGAGLVLATIPAGPMVKERVKLVLVLGVLVAMLSRERSSHTT